MRFIRFAWALRLSLTLETRQVSNAVLEFELARPLVRLILIYLIPPVSPRAMPTRFHNTLIGQHWQRMTPR